MNDFFQQHQNKCNSRNVQVKLYWNRNFIVLISKDMKHESNMMILLVLVLLCSLSWSFRNKVEGWSILIGTFPFIILTQNAKNKYVNLCKQVNIN